MPGASAQFAQQLDEAMRSALRATDYDPNLAAAWIIRAECEMELNRFNIAVVSNERAVELEPHNWQAYWGLGQAYSKCHRHDNAVDALQRAAEINPRSHSVWVSLAVALSDRGSYSAAARSIDRALVLAPDDAMSWAIRGLINWRWRRDRPTVQASLERALQLDPQDSVARFLANELTGTAAPLCASPSPTAKEPLETRTTRRNLHEISRCRYWMCPCGGVFEKELLEQHLSTIRRSGEIAVSGSLTCGHCHRVYDSADIFGGKHDLPREHWAQVETRQGKPALL